MADTYKRREFTYRGIVNDANHRADFDALGIDPSAYFDGLVLVVNLELGVIEQTFPTLDDFNARYVEAT